MSEVTKEAVTNIRGESPEGAASISPGRKSWVDEKNGTEFRRNGTQGSKTRIAKPDP